MKGNGQLIDAGGGMVQVKGNRLLGNSRDLGAGGFQNLLGQLYFSVSSSEARQIPGDEEGGGNGGERLCWLCWS